jgi:hypothetical protein
MEDYFAHLEVLPIATKAPAERQTFPCEHCGGSGKWRGGVNKAGEGKCYACKGKGHFMSSRQDRRKARKQRKQSAAKRIHDGAAALQEANPGLFEGLLEIQSWNSFAADLLRQWTTKGNLSEKQIEAANRMLAKIAANKAKREEAKADAVVVDLTVIREMFEKVYASGYKRPTYRAGDLVISRAPDNGKNAGHLYVKHGDDYQGKITPDGRFLPVRDADTSVAALLQTIAADPKGEAVRHGAKTGNCSCCGRELTNAKSVKAGIGPICAERWF